MSSKLHPTGTSNKPTNPLEWRWPLSPQVFRVYDKYSDVEATLVIGEERWKFSERGNWVYFNFESKLDRLLQQKLVILTQEDRSPSSVCKFTRSLLKNWATYLRILTDGPSKIFAHWQKYIKDIDTAKAAKSILTRAAKSSLGDWTPAHLALIKGLDTNANSTVRAQQSRVARREKLLSAAEQTSIVAILDKGSLCSPIPQWEAEALATLALMFQHGMRAVQLISLKIEHIQIITDATNNQICLISFHTAKQKDGETMNGEMVRQVRSEWARPVCELYENAKRNGRIRLFQSTTSAELWRKVKHLYEQAGLKLKFSSGSLRHSSAQALADNGHSRKSIQKFLGHKNISSATPYLRASKRQGQLVNRAIGASRLYNEIVLRTKKEYLAPEELADLPESEQIGAIVGDRLVAGIGRCSSQQSSCPYDPVLSCYGCYKYMPALDPSAHLEAIAGMREQIVLFIKNGGAESSPGYLQMTKSLSGAQRALEETRRILRGHE